MATILDTCCNLFSSSSTDFFKLFDVVCALNTGLAGFIILTLVRVAPNVIQCRLYFLVLIILVSIGNLVRNLMIDVNICMAHPFIYFLYIYKHFCTKNRVNVHGKNTLPYIPIIKNITKLRRHRTQMHTIPILIFTFHSFKGGWEGYCYGWQAAFAHIRILLSHLPDPGKYSFCCFMLKPCGLLCLLLASL